MAGEDYPGILDFAIGRKKGSQFVEVEMPRNPDKVRCKAKSKRTGNQCKRWATKGYQVCRYHGANPDNRGGAPAKNKNAMTYGVFVDKLLDKEEKELCDWFFQGLLNDFELTSSVDKKVAKKACQYYIRLVRALESDNINAIYKMSNLVNKQIKLIKSISEKNQRKSFENAYLSRALQMFPDIRDKVDEPEG